MNRSTWAILFTGVVLSTATSVVINLITEDWSWTLAVALALLVLASVVVAGRTWRAQMAGTSSADPRVPALSTAGQRPSFTQNTLNTDSGHVTHRVHVGMRDWRFAAATLIVLAALVTVVVVVIEFALDTRQAPTVEAPTAAPLSPLSQTPPSQSSAPALAVMPSGGKPLADLDALAGGSFLEREAGTTTFTIACASNRDGDMYRAVQFAIPRRDAATFSGHVSPIRIQDDVGVAVRVDNLVKAGLTLQPDQRPSALTAEIAGGSTLELRLTCSRPGGAVTFSEAVLAK